MTLNKPGGGSIDSLDDGQPGIRFVTGATHQIAYIGTPELEVGDWDVVVSGDTITSDGSYGLHVLTTDPRTGVSASGQGGESIFTFPDPMVIEVTVDYSDALVVDSVVTADVELPNGSILPVQLLDDGNVVVSGDKIAGDGVYTTQLTQAQYAFAGVYDFEIKVTNTIGSGYQGETLFNSVGHPINVPTIQQFERAATLSLVLIGRPVPTLPNWGWPLIALLIAVTTLLIMTRRRREPIS
jgi:hypothetical protein